MPASPKAMDLILTHRSELISYARRIVGNHSTAEDVVQEAYLKYWAHAGSGAGTPEPITEPVGYLYRIVRNLAFDWQRRPARTLTSNVSSDILSSYPAPDASPEADAMWRQELAAVQSVIDSLPERTRIAFEMHRLGGMTLQDVADHLEISVTRAHQLIKQALMKCALHLEKLERNEHETAVSESASEKKRGSRV
ncbi:sigma-70 family RNA polymerase sigma factor [Nisaea nitritireducens]|uniref:sigma-70 family RNA polymerase sigma factor n=1 Tax=Nisaea nitritireducens TaxID=568392 RepID=UPI001865DC7A|nr:sigma-70 family RNA polymerase sigma factor [Nisaea nitritireducens]